MHLGRAGESIFHLSGPRRKGIFLAEMKLMTNVSSPRLSPLSAPLYNLSALVSLASVICIVCKLKGHSGVICLFRRKLIEAGEMSTIYFSSLRS